MDQGLNEVFAACGSSIWLKPRLEVVRLVANLERETGKSWIKGGGAKREWLILNRLLLQIVDFSY